VIVGLAALSSRLHPAHDVARPGAGRLHLIGIHLTREHIEATPSAIQPPRKPQVTERASKASHFGMMVITPCARWKC
jgi:hypothetical protein